MKRARKPVLLTAGASLLALSACTDPGQLGGQDPNQNTKQGAVVGGILGAGLGALLGGDQQKGAVIGGAAGAMAGAAYGNYLDKQEAELRRDLENDDIRITNTGVRLVVSMPQEVLVAVDSSNVNSGMRQDLLTVSRSLQQYPDSRVQVIGHTDNTGGADYNQRLSERRADSVADVLMNGGVPMSRLEIIGRGEDQPVASNLTDEGRAQNRRVEIVILPTA